MSPGTLQLRERHELLRYHLGLLVEQVRHACPHDAALAELVDAAALHLGPACIACGCTDALACEDGCFWVRDNLCSTCDAIGLEVAFSVRQRDQLALSARWHGLSDDAGALVHLLVERHLAGLPS